MRRFLIVTLAVICAGYLFWKFVLTRSATIRLEKAGYDLTYTMAWGWGMAEKISIVRVGTLTSGTSSEWIKVLDKPYNSGLVVYRSAEDETYYLGAGYRLFIFDPSQGTLKASCDPKDTPAYTDLAQQISSLGGRERETTDPGARSIFNYIEPSERGGAVPALPPDSRYYANLKYLGRFGLVRSEGRGHEVRFVPSDKTAEPRRGLDFSCG